MWGGEEPAGGFTAHAAVDAGRDRGQSVVGLGEVSCVAAEVV